MLYKEWIIAKWYRGMLEKEMATHSSILAWRIPGTEEPGGLPSMGSHTVRHNWSSLAAATEVCTSYLENRILEITQSE